MSTPSRTVLVIAAGCAVAALVTARLAWPWTALGCTGAIAIGLAGAPRALRVRGAPLAALVALAAIVGLAATMADGI